MRVRLLSLVLGGVAASALHGAGAAPGYLTQTYKHAGGVDLHVHIFAPTDGERAHPAIAFFFGGGWTHGEVAQFHPFASYFASRGMVAVCAEYRTALIPGTTPFDCVSDARSTLRWVRANAARLGIDPQRIVASGGSAGAQLAAACVFAKSLDAVTDDATVDPRPNALVLFNPVIDTGPGGYAAKRIGARYPEFSPIHNLSAATPPTIIFLGTDDAVTPVATAKRYVERMTEHHVRCDLRLYAGQKHGFYVFKETGNPFYQRVLFETDRFLASMGYVAGEPSVTVSPDTAPLPP